jgi:2-dehydro-3-deoxyphosphogluconate aldolase/(4S)-4-hydroxy-2-oxoglutarate aldolase
MLYSKRWSRWAALSTNVLRKATMTEAKILTGQGSTRNQDRVTPAAPWEGSLAAALTREEVCALIERVGLVPSLRLESTDDALFAAESLAAAGVPIIEVSMAEAGALDILSHLARHASGMIVGAGSVCDTDTAIRSLGAGAKFLMSDIFVPQVVELAAGDNVAVIPGALTPTEIMTAWNAGADFVKVSPCDAKGHEYLRSLKGVLPQVSLIAAGGITQLNALGYVKAGAAALSVGAELFPPEAIWLRQTNRIQELARRFVNAVDTGRVVNQRTDT